MLVPSISLAPNRAGVIVGTVVGCLLLIIILAILIWLLIYKCDARFTRYEKEVSNDIRYRRMYCIHTKTVGQGWATLMGVWATKILNS